MHMKTNMKIKVKTNTIMILEIAGMKIENK